MMSSKLCLVLVEKKKIYDTETLSNDRTLNKEPFYEKIMQKMCTKG